MTDAAAIARHYIDTWNEPDEARRRALLARHWSEDAGYVDPLMHADGTVQVAGLVAAVQQRFPGFRFALTGTPDGHGEFVRLSWSLGPEGGAAPIEGSDVVELRDGRIGRVIGFIDRAPAA